jgi:hypothetical protein
MGGRPAFRLTRAVEGMLSNFLLFFLLGQHRKVTRTVNQGKAVVRTARGFSFSTGDKFYSKIF